MRLLASRNLTIGRYTAPILVLLVLISTLFFLPGLTFSSGNPPIADAGWSERIVYLQRSIELDGSDSTDSENDPLTYKWEVITKPANSSAQLLDRDGETADFTPDVVGQYVVRLVVNDGTSDSAPYDIKITARRPPWAKKNAFINVKCELRAGDPLDSGNSTMSYEWTIVKKPKGSDPLTYNTNSVIAYISPDKAGVYELRVNITDNADGRSFSFITEITARHYPCSDANDPPYPYGVDKPWQQVLCDIGKGVPNKIADFAKKELKLRVKNFFSPFIMGGSAANEKAMKQFLHFFGEKADRINYKRVSQSMDLGWRKVWPMLKKEASDGGFLGRLKNEGVSILKDTLGIFKAEAEKCIKNIMFLVMDKMIDQLIEDSRPQPPTIVRLELGDKVEGGKYVKIYFKRSPGDKGPGKSGNLHFYYKLWRWSTGNKIVPLFVGKENGPYGPLATGPNNDQEPLVFYDPVPPEGNNYYRVQAIRIIGKSQIEEKTWDEMQFWIEQLAGVACPPLAAQISYVKTYSDRALKILKGIKFQKSKLSIPENIYVPKPFERGPLPVSLATNYSTGEVFASLPFTNSIYRIKGDTLQLFVNTHFKDPHQVGLAIDSAGNIYSDNSASDAKFGGRIFRWNENGVRQLFGTVNYFSQMLGYSKPCAVQSMVTGWAGEEKLFITDLYEGVLKELVIPPKGLPSNVNHHVAQTLVKEPSIEVNNKTSMCVNGFGEVLLTGGNNVFKISPEHTVETIFADPTPFTELAGIDTDSYDTIYLSDYGSGTIYAFTSEDIMFPSSSSELSDPAYISLHTLVSGLDRPGELRLTADQHGLVWFSGSGFSHHVFGLSGRIISSETGEPLVGALVSCEDRGTVQMTKTNIYGVFHLPGLSLSDFSRELALLVRYRNQSGTYRVFLNARGETFIDPLIFTPDEVPTEVSDEPPVVIQPDPPAPMTVLVTPGEVTFFDNMEVTIPGFQPPAGHEFPPQPSTKPGAPLVEIVNPVDGLKTVFDELAIVGVVSDPRVSRVALEVNGNIRNVDVNDRKFTATVPIQIGLNHIKAMATVVENGESLTGRSESVNIRRLSTEETPATGMISGILKDKTTGNPASGIRVELVGTDKFAISDPLGTWQIADVPPGLVTIQILP